MTDHNATTTSTDPRLGSLTERRTALEARHPVWVPRALHEVLDEAADQWPDRPYVVTDTKIHSYTEIRDRSLRIARGLVEAGVRPGDHVALEMANYPEFVAVKFAISRAGATAVPVNYLNRRDELAYLQHQSRASTLITMARHRDLDYLAMLDDIAPGWPTEGGGAALPNLRRVVVFDNDSRGVPAQAATLAQLETDAPTAATLPEVAADATVDIIYTSGTTGGPKGVQLTHDMVLRTAYGAAYGRGFEDGRRIIFAMPMYHVYGYIEGMLPVLFVGGAIVPHLVFDPAATITAIERHRVTDMLAIPTMTLNVLDTRHELIGQGRSPDLSSLASLLSSGAASPPGIWDRIDNELDCAEVTTGYGMSETTASTTVTRPDDDPSKRRTTNGRLRDVGVAGDPSLGGKLVIYRAADPETGEDVGFDTIGELQAFGPGVTTGYWDKPEATSVAFTTDGWFRTGDLGTIDEDGYVRLVGRTKDSYRCGGEQVLPKEAEDILLEHPAVAQALVVPVPDPKMGETGAAYIVLRDGATVEPEELRQRVASQLAKFKVPKHVLFIDAEAIPLTASGRPRRFLLAERAARELALDEPSRS